MHLNDPVIVLEGDIETTPTELDLTELCSSCTLNFSRPPAANQNTFGVRGQRRELKSIWDGSLAITFHHEYGDGEATQILWAWLSAEESVDFRVRAQDAEVSTSNPEWRGKLCISELPTVDGGPEDIAAATVTWQVDGVPEMHTTPES